MLLAHALLFFVASFAAYLRNVDRGSSFGGFLLLALPVVGVYFLGWWALATYIAGLYIGGRVFWEGVKSRNNDPEA